MRLIPLATLTLVLFVAAFGCEPSKEERIAMMAAAQTLEGGGKVRLSVGPESLVVLDRLDEQWRRKQGYDGIPIVTLWNYLPMDLVRDEYRVGIIRALRQGDFSTAANITVKASLNK